MKKYNERLLQATKKLSQDTRDKSTKKVYKLTHPSNKVNKIGSTIGKSIGIGLLIVGSIASIGGCLWGMGSCVAGALTVASHKIKDK